MNKSDMPYRQAILALVIDSDNNFLIVQLNEFADDEWKFISGGLNPKEKPEEGLYRELEEELSLSAEHFELIGKSKYKHIYDFPEKNGKNIDGVDYRGQEKHQFLLKLKSGKKDINLLEKEMKGFKWVQFNELEKYLKFPDQLENARKVAKEFGIDK